MRLFRSLALCNQYFEDRVYVNKRARRLLRMLALTPSGYFRIFLMLSDALVVLSIEYPILFSLHETYQMVKKAENIECIVKTQHIVPSFNLPYFM